MLKKVLRRWPLLLIALLVAIGATTYWSVRRRDAILAQVYPILPGPSGVWAKRRFVGVEACRQCHAERVAAYQRTSHFNSMRMPDLEKPAGHFPAKLVTFRPDVTLEAYRQGKALAVTSIEQQPAGDEIRHTESVAMIMGSGKLSHSLFYRQGDALYQMPLFFFAPLNEWMLVPGFMDIVPFWDRAIKPRCLDCHSTYFEHVPHTRNEYRYESAILPISCERCHGRGSEHVAYHQAHPEAGEAVAIVNPAALPRQRQLEVCGLCHGESGRLLKEAFSYTPGEPLVEYVVHDKDGDDNFVRSANQSQRLEIAKCFQKSSEMVCTTCHNPHQMERDDLPTFSQRCQSCHEAGSHPQANEIGPRLRQNCIDCHMPKRDDEILPFRVASGDHIKLIQMRDHAIAIYPDETKMMRQQWARPDGQLAAANSRPALARQRMLQSWLRKAQACLSINDQPGMRNALEQALRYDPENEATLLALADFMVREKNMAAAEQLAKRALTAHPESTKALLNLAIYADSKGDRAMAIARYRQLLAIAPEDPGALNNLAWLLAVSREPQFRDGQEAVRLAEKLLTEPSQMRYSRWDTLAAAYAEANQFDRAVDAAQKALAAAKAAQPQDQPAIQGIQGRLESYRRGQPYHEAQPPAN